jgi:hypothetical protein
MRHRRYALGATIIACTALVVTAPAYANYYLTKNGARAATRTFVHNAYGFNRGDIATSCRPQGRSKPRARSVNHRWVCGWAIDVHCGGSIRVVGSSSAARWAGRLVHGLRCDDGSSPSSPGSPSPPVVPPPVPRPVLPPRAPAPVVPPPGPTPSTASCNPNYSGACLDRPGDYDCLGGTGDGPNYTGTVFVIGVDVYDLDRDSDGIGCE